MIAKHRILAGFLLLTVTVAGSASEDGLDLEASRGPAIENVTLDWTGGQPLFRIYRSTSPVDLVDPSNLLVETSERTWTDESADLPPGGVYHYKTQGACGNGNLEPGEECDDGNVVGGDGCSPVYTNEGPVCGDGTLDPGETCDPPGDPAGASGNICRSDCTVCGDGIQDPGEECDDGNSNNLDGCRNDCSIPTCGDGILDPGETCDPPGSPAGASGNLCRGDCTVCGDGIPQAGEECDDGNANNGDGCRNDCTSG